ncbi:MAG: A/G-specific adenine glycosylase [bacterium]|nr:A/G-specific adenine glycosylase [bacterium]
MNSPESKAQALCRWFDQTQRPLPWRAEYAPYQVWISEIMAQQTRMDQLIPYYLRWMKALPDIAALAEVPEDQLLKLWEGLGYYNRARNLKLAAQKVMAQGGKLPMGRKELLDLPGIGPYTAGAILSIAFNQPEPLIDGNIERVLARLLDLDINPKTAAGKRYFEAEVAALMRGFEPRKVAQGLMELGALVCSPTNPNCGECPWGGDCLARQKGTIEARPVLPPRPEGIKEKRLVLVLEESGQFYLLPQPKGARWGGMELFLMPLVERWPQAEGLTAHLPEGVALAGTPQYLGEFRYTVTKYRVQAQAWRIPIDRRPSGGLWLSLEELEARALPRPGVKTRELLRGALKPRNAVAAL